LLGRTVFESQAFTTDVKSPFPVLGPEAFFSQATCLEIEIGCGKGRFLANHAAVYPARYFIGIEVAKSYAKLAEECLQKRKIANVRILTWSAELLLPFVQSSSVSRFHIYFPDPWPKRRHERRRLWTPEFLGEIRRILKQDGKVYFATDYVEYFERVLALVETNESPFTVERREDFRFFEDAPSPTSYENKYIREGRKLGFASFIRKAVPQ